MRSFYKFFLQLAHHNLLRSFEYGLTSDVDESTVGSSRYVWEPIEGVDNWTVFFRGIALTVKLLMNPLSPSRYAGVFCFKVVNISHSFDNQRVMQS